jgi:hypothetical protein
MADPRIETLRNWQKQYQSMTDRERANARISSGRGTAADSVFVGLKPRPTAPAPEKLYSPDTELGQTMWRLTQQDFTPEERSAFGQSFLPHQGYPGSLQALADSTRADQEFNLFGGQFAQGKQPEPTALMREAQFSGGIAAEAARERGLPEATAAADSVSALTEAVDIGLGRQARATAEPTTELERRYGYLNKTKPGTPEHDAAQRAIDIQLQQEEPNVSYEAALKGYAAARQIIHNIVNGKNLSELEMLIADMRPAGGENNKFIGGLARDAVKDPEAKKKLLKAVEDQARFYDNIVIQEDISVLTEKMPPSKNKKGVVDVGGNRYYRNTGTEWIPIEKPPTIR